MMVLDEILKRNGLAEIDGRAIYEYEVTGDEYHALGSALAARATRSAYSWSNAEAAEFCIYIAEWWRRSYDGGPWSYDEALKTLDMSAWGVAARQPWLRDLIRRGVKYLDRKLISLGNTQYLGTLATEGGLPLNLLEKEGNSLRKAFQRIFSDLSTYGALHRDSEQLGKQGVVHLSNTFQKVQTLPTLLGDIALITWKYAQLIDEQGDALDALNANYPGWKSELPLRVDDEQARVFLNQIFGDAQKEHREAPASFRTYRRLVQYGDTWRLSVFVDTPKKIFAAQLANLLGVDKGALPYHLALKASSAHGAILFASASCQKEAYRLDSTEAQFVGSGHQAAGALRLVAFEGINEFAGSNTPLAEPLDAGPWIFSTPAAEMPSQLFSTGSVRTRQESVVMAVEPGGHFQPDAGGTHEFLGTLEGLNRDLYQVLGEVCFVDTETTRWRVKCAQEADAFVAISLRGERFNFEHARGLPVYGDRPSVQIDHRRPPLHELRWKTNSGEVSWHQAGFGDGRIRIYDDEDNVTFQRKVCRLPEDAAIHYVAGAQRQGGHLILENFGRVDVGSANPAIRIDSRIEGTKLLATPIFEGEGDAPADFAMHIRWRESDTATQLTVPFPAESARFVANGQVLPHRAAWNAHALDQIRAEFSPANALSCEPVIVGSLYAEDVTQELREAVEFTAAMIPEYVGARPTGRYQLPLARIRSYVDLALAGTMSLDARVELCLEWSGCSLREKKSLDLYRYEGDIEPLPSNRFAITSNQESPATQQNVALRVFRFRDPGAVHELVATTDDEWIAPEATFEPGTWCALGTRNGHLSHRPYIFKIEGDTPTDDWSLTCEVPDRDTRRERFRALYAEMAMDPAHAGWSSLAATFEAAKQLPATTFDALDCLTQVPQATAMALVLAGGGRIERWWNELNELPFAWYLISMSDWAHAFKRYGQIMQAQLAGLKIAFVPREHLGPVISYTERQLGAPSPIFAHLDQLYEFGLDIPNDDLRAARQLDEFVYAGLTEELQELFSRKNPDDFQWPKWRPQTQFQELPLFAKLRVNAGIPWRQPVADAPVLAAIACVTGLRLARPDVLRIRRLRDFDTRWFDQCYRITLARAIVALDSHPNFIKSSIPLEA